MIKPNKNMVAIHFHQKPLKYRYMILLKFAQTKAFGPYQRGKNGKGQFDENTNLTFHCFSTIFSHFSKQTVFKRSVKGQHGKEKST